MSKIRTQYIDVARGIAILGMLIGHAMHLLNCRIDYILDWFWSFHMPLFVIVAGMFYKKKPIKDLVWGGIKTLIIPFYIVALLSFFLFQLLCAWNGLFSVLVFFNDLFKILTINRQIVPFGFWFVLSLFVARIYYFLILAISSNRLIQLSLSLLLFIFGYYFVPISQSWFFCTQGLLFPMFMCVGQMIKQRELIDKANHMGVSIFCILVLSFAPFFNIDLSIFKLPLGLFNIITASVICFALFNICNIICGAESFLFNKLNSILQFCGRHSMVVLSFHSIVIYFQFWKVVKYIEPNLCVVMFTMATIMFAYLYVALRAFVTERKTIH